MSRLGSTGTGEYTKKDYATDNSATPPSSQLGSTGTIKLTKTDYGTAALSAKDAKSFLCSRPATPRWECPFDQSLGQPPTTLPFTYTPYMFSLYTCFVPAPHFSSPWGHVPSIMVAWDPPPPPYPSSYTRTRVLSVVSGMGTMQVGYSSSTKSSTCKNHTELSKSRP